MKHHNKFAVKKFSDPDQYEITYSPLGSVRHIGIAGFEHNTPIKQVLTLDEQTIQTLLNAVFDDAYEKGRQAVKAATIEAMGFDGE